MAFSPSEVLCSALYFIGNIFLTMSASFGGRSDSLAEYKRKVKWQMGGPAHHPSLKLQVMLLLLSMADRTHQYNWEPVQSIYSTWAVNDGSLFRSRALWVEWELLIIVNTSSIWKPNAKRTTGAHTHTDTLNHWVYLPSSSGLVVAPDGWGCYRHLLWGVKHEKFITHVIEPCMIHLNTFCLGDDPLSLSVTSNSENCGVGYYFCYVYNNSTV